jgi:hypothetical protein|tara:strand:- start:123 stop:335 length:213 start_codon:yes stop_codon:yes gene_type:complete
LGRQIAKEAVLKSPELLGIRFQSGDILEIETAEHEYESVIFNFPPLRGSKPARVPGVSTQRNGNIEGKTI